MFWFKNPRVYLGLLELVVWGKGFGRAEDGRSGSQRARVHDGLYPSKQKLKLLKQELPAEIYAWPAHTPADEVEAMFPAYKLLADARGRQQVGRRCTQCTAMQNMQPLQTHQAMKPLNTENNEDHEQQ